MRVGATAIFALTVLALAQSGCGGEAAGPANSGNSALSPARPSEVAEVVSVIDGATLEVRLDGKSAVVRLLCVSVEDPATSRGETARKMLQFYCSTWRQRVRLERDPAVSEPEGAGHLPRYVFNADPKQAPLEDTFANLLLVQKGHANLLPELGAPSVYRDELLKAGRNAFRLAIINTNSAAISVRREITEARKSGLTLEEHNEMLAGLGDVIEGTAKMEAGALGITSRQAAELLKLRDMSALSGQNRALAEVLAARAKIEDSVAVREHYERMATLTALLADAYQQLYLSMSGLAAMA